MLFTNKHASGSFPCNQKRKKKTGKCFTIGLCSKSGRSQGFRVEKPSMFLPVRQQYTTWIYTTKWHITQRSRSPWALRCLFVCTAPSLDTSFRRSHVSADVMTNIAIQIGSIFTKGFSLPCFASTRHHYASSHSIYPQFNRLMAKSIYLPTYLHKNYIK